MACSVSVVGGGLAGVECALKLSEFGFDVTLFEMKPYVISKAHRSRNFAELVCSNSFKSTELHTPPGLLKEEMKCLGSTVLQCAQKSSVPGSKALVVDREQFSRLVTECVEASSVKICRKAVKSLEELKNFDFKVICTGPLTWEPFAEDLKSFLGGSFLHFFDAVSPIIDGASIDFSKGFWGSRHSTDADYFNVPLSKDEYYEFIEMLTKAEKFEPVLAEEKDYKTFNGCQPVEDIASKGKDSLRFGQLSPRGLAKDAYAVIQLRRENLQGDAFSIVGFQTRLKHPEQKKLFQSLPALRNCEILRYGVMHRNTYLHSPSLLNPDLSLKKDNSVYFAGQITGVEGYLESAACGLYVAYQIICKKIGFLEAFPKNSILGGLINYVTSYSGEDFQPMNANFGLLDSKLFLAKDKRLGRIEAGKLCISAVYKWARHVRESFALHCSQGASPSNLDHKGDFT